MSASLPSIHADVEVFEFTVRKREPLLCHLCAEWRKRRVATALTAQRRIPVCLEHWAEVAAFHPPEAAITYSPRVRRYTLPTASRDRRSGRQ